MLSVMGTHHEAQRWHRVAGCGGIQVVLAIISVATVLSPAIILRLVLIALGTSHLHPALYAVLMDCPRYIPPPPASRKSVGM